MTMLFTDIEGSTALWERDGPSMSQALAAHDALTRSAIEGHRGTVVKMTGDGVHAVFSDARDALMATLQLQQALEDPGATLGITLRVRCGLHAGIIELRDGDYFGSPVNRAARIMSAAHGGQVLVSQAVADAVCAHLPVSVSLRSLGKVRLKDLSAPEHVYQVVHPSLRAEFPVLRSLEAVPNNLPQQLTSFVGRERDLADAGKLLTEHRLLTLHATGGIGKTRLSLQIAAECMDRFPDGVWLIELADLTDARLLPRMLAKVLGVKEEGDRPLIDTLIQFVANRQLLLVLDNCEHLVQGCADLAARLLTASTHLKVVASSREPLRIQGEVVYPLMPLPVPHESALLKRHTVKGYAAAQLFIERALAVQVAFDLSDENAIAVASICRQLDGIPLALELAAARVRALSVHQIEARLSDRFRLLTSGDRTALPRQQTLRALVDWSYELLSPEEGILFRRIALFAGGFTLEAAEAIAHGGEGGESDVLTTLPELVGKSLVVFDAERDRYRLLETIRHYAQEQLAASGEADEIRAVHASFYLEFAEKASPKLFGAQQARWHEQLDLERENILAAHECYGRADHDAALGLRLVHAMKYHLICRGQPGLGRRLTLEALARAGAQRRDAARSGALFDVGQTCCFMGRYDEARPLLEQGLEIAREIGDLRRVAAILQALGLAALGQGDRVAARAHFEEAVALARQRGIKREIAAALNALAQLHRVDNALDVAEPLFDQVVALARELGDQETIAIGLLNLAMVSIARKTGARARSTLIEVCMVVNETWSTPVGQSFVEVCAGLAELEQDWARTARFFGMAEAHNHLTGLRRDPVDEAFLAQHVTDARSRLGDMAFRAAETAGRTVGFADAVAEAQAWLHHQG
ncbi:MAG TPA: tetratricopeptide repeat protein [Casimicrobiaceae bacterium]